MPHRWKGTVVGLVLGAAITAIGLGLFALIGDTPWVLWVTKVSAWLGFWVMDDWYQGFPTNVNTALTNGLLILAGAAQWGIVGLICDVGRRLVDRKGQETPTR